MAPNEHSFTKRDFKDIRALLKIGVEREFVIGLETVEASIREWRTAAPESSREWYHRILEDHKAHRKVLSRTYDNNSKSMMRSSIEYLLRNNILTWDDLDICSEGAKANFRWVLELKY
ncbi:MAG: hypothetical protein ACI81P_002948 [Neolewinella sp.]|jgi:hypothetical protein